MALDISKPTSNTRISQITADTRENIRALLQDSLSFGGTKTFSAAAIFSLGATFVGASLFQNDVTLSARLALGVLPHAAFKMGFTGYIVGQTGVGGSASLALTDSATDGNTLFAINRYGSAHAMKANVVEFWNAVAGALVFATSSTERMRIDDAAMTVAAALLANGGLSVGAAGTSLTQIRVYLPALTPAAVAANTTAEQAFAVAGLATTDTVFVNKPTTQPGLGIAGCRATAGTLHITFVNATGAAITPIAGQVYRVVAIRS